MATEFEYKYMICLKSEKYNSVITKSLFNRIKEQTPDIDIDIIFDNFKEVIIVEAISRERIFDKEGRGLPIIVYSGRIYKTDENNKFNIDDQIYFLEEQVEPDGVVDILKPVVLYPNCVYNTENKTIEVYKMLHPEKVKPIDVSHMQTETNRLDPSDIVKPIIMTNPKIEPKIVSTSAWTNIGETPKDKSDDKPVEIVEDVLIIDATSDIEFEIINNLNVDELSNIINVVIDLYKTNKKILKNRLVGAFIDTKIREKIYSLSTNKDEFDRIKSCLNFYLDLYKKAGHNKSIEISCNHYKIDQTKFRSLLSIRNNAIKSSKKI